MTAPGGNDVAPEIRERAARVRLILLDVDGVMTDGRIYVDADGRELKAFDVWDGHGIRMGQQAGLQFGFVTGRESGSVTHRAAELGITEVHQKVYRKAERVQEIVQRLEIDWEEVCFVGDDLIDIPVMRAAGLAVAPANAMPQARESAHHVTSRRGGRGAVREVIELVLHAKGKWDEVTRRYFE